MTRNPLAIRDPFAVLRGRRGYPVDVPAWGDFDRLFDRFWGSVEAAPSERPAPSVAPRVDLSETDAAYAIDAELPGMDAKEVEILLEGDRLTLKGEKNTEFEAGDPNRGHYLRERSHGNFRRAFRLPDNVDRDAIEAGFDKGVLTITLPKLAEQTSKVEIKAG